MSERRYVLTIYGIDIELPDADTALELSMAMKRSEGVTVSLRIEEPAAPLAAEGKGEE